MITCNGYVKYNYWFLIESFEELFTRQIDEGRHDQYKPTAAIAEVLTGEHAAMRVPSNLRPSSGHIGITYKSVVTQTIVSQASLDQEYGVNYAFHPTIVNEFLELTLVIEAEVVSRTNNSLNLRISDYSDSFENGKVQWSGNPQSVSFHDLISNGNNMFEGITWTF